MKTSEFICFEATITNLQARDRDGAIKEMVQALHKAGKLGKNSPDKIAKSVIERENEASTGIGKGVAVPHVKHDDMDQISAVVGLTDEGIDFSSLDKQPVFSIILLVSAAKQPDKHLAAMERIFKLLQDERFRKFLRQAKTVEDVKDLFLEADQGQQ